MEKWSKEQLQAIRHRGSPLLVTAGAGSGKTAVLVERIIRLVLEEGVDLETLLVMTFTKAAAQEMKERIQEQLETALASQEETSWIEEQLDKLPGAQISTIHSFCSRLIRAHAAQWGLDPHSKTLEQEEEALIVEDELNQLFVELYREKPEEMAFLVDGFCYTRSDQGLRTLMLSLLEFLRGAPDPFGWMDASIAHFQVEGAFGESKAFGDMKEMLGEELDQVWTLLGHIKILVEEQLPYLKPTVQEDEELLRRLTVLLQEDWDGFVSLMYSLSFATMKRKKAEDDIDLQAHEAFKIMREDMKKLLRDIILPMVPKDLEVLSDSMQKLHQRLSSLRQLMRLFWDRLEERKRRDKWLSFSDLEHYALAMLRDDAIQQSLRGRFQFVFVDEYQDTSLIQEEIIQRVSREDNLFMVGDVKQSIYRFRQAAPEVFLAKRALYEKRGDLGQLIHLNRNFRCANPIVQTINGLFMSLMSHELGEIDYDHKEALVYGANLDAEQRPVSVHWINKDALHIQEETFADLVYMEREAKIAALLLAKEQGKEFYDHKQDQLRPMEWKDMVVILRTRKDWGEKYVKALKEAGIPVHMEKTQGYFDAVEIRVFLEVLSLVDNKDQDYAWISFLRSPMVGLTDEDLALLLGERKVSVARLLYEQKHPWPLVEKAKEWVLRWQRMREYMDVGSLVQQILLDTRWLELVGVMEDAEQKKANLRLLALRANRYGESHFEGLSGFLHMLKKLGIKEFDPGLASTVGEQDNVVRVLTVHGAKGLEYPLVLLGAVGKGFNMSEAKETLQTHRLLGLGPDLVDTQLHGRMKSVQKRRIVKKMRQESLSEELRTFYVALTRAKNRLILLGGLSKTQIDKGENPYLRVLHRGSSIGEWIYPVLLHHRHDFLEMSFVDEQALGEEVLTERINRSKRRKELEDWLGRQADSYPVEEVPFLCFPEAQRLRALLPSKLGVTDVYRLSSQRIQGVHQGKPFKKRTPIFLSKKSGLAGKERGLVLHKVMQNLLFLQVGTVAEIERQLDQMVVSEILLEEERSIVDPKELFALFESDMGQRILSAKAVYRELPFNVRYDASLVFEDAQLKTLQEDILLQGVMDMVFEEPDGLVLLDYKSDSQVQAFFDPQSETYRKYAHQLMLYRMALTKLSGLRVKETGLYLFASKQWLMMEV